MLYEAVYARPKKGAFQPWDIKDSMDSSFQINLMMLQVNDVELRVMLRSLLTNLYVSTYCGEKLSCPRHQ